jgi:hypothetical protein
MLCGQHSQLVQVLKRDISNIGDHQRTFFKRDHMVLPLSTFH